MKSFTLLALMAGLLGANPDWERKPASMLITSATLWKVNTAEKLDSRDPESVVQHLKNASFAKHTLNEHKKFLVLDKDKVKTHKAYMKLEYDKDKGEYVVDEAKFVEKLRSLGLNLPP